MERRGLSLLELQEMPKESLILLAGPPGAGKSSFCHQVVLHTVAAGTPVIFVTTEQSPLAVARTLSEKGIGEPSPAALGFVDAFTETVGVETQDRPDTVRANCMDLNSLSIATVRLQEKTGSYGTLLVFDSLTSPYLFSGVEIVKFMRLFLCKFVAQGNSVLAAVDEGCGQEEDLGAMMSVADGIIRMEIREDSRIINVVKHPKVGPAKMEIPMKPKPTIKSAFDALRSTQRFDPGRMRQWVRSMSGQGQALRREAGDFVNLFWPSFAHWSGVLWDPKGFPTMIYDVNKEDGASSTAREMLPYYPRRERFLMKSLPSLRALGLFPKGFSNVADMKWLSKQAGGGPWGTPAKWERSGTIEYLEDASTTDEHYFRIHQSADCWGFEDVGAAMASHLPPHMAGRLSGLDSDGRDWNAVETKCIGLGDPCCEFKLVPGEIDGLRASLEKDASVVQRIHQRLMERLMGFLLDEKPIVERPGFGSDVHLHPVVHSFGFPYLAMGSERFRMALRMGGAKSGKEVGERLMEAGIDEDHAIDQVVDLMNYCKVGKTALGETIRMSENCESFSSWLFVTGAEPSCHFTTGFLNGLFSAVRNQHVREIRCIAAGDPYCEWEIT